MDADRKTAIVAGVLFIIATGVDLLGTALTGPITGASDLLGAVAANPTRLSVGALCQFIAAIASAAIAISLYPVLRRYREGLALGAVAMRVIEAVFGVVATLGLLTLVTLSQDASGATPATTAYYQTLAVLVLAIVNWSGFTCLALAFTIGAFLYYWVFYETGLIPRWLAGWGLVAILMSMSAAVLTIFGLKAFSPVSLVLNLPIAVQEMVLAVWLIGKGFQRPVVRPEPGASGPRPSPAVDAAPREAGTG